MPNPPFPVYFLLLHEENPDHPLHNAPWKFSPFRELLRDISEEEYPSKGLWPPNDEDLPLRLTRGESDKLRAFYKQAKATQNASELCKLRAGEGKAVMVRFFGRLFLKAKLMEQLGRFVLSLGFDPVVLRLEGAEYRINKIGPLLQAPLGQFLFGEGCLYNPNSSIKMVNSAFEQVLTNSLYHIFRRVKYRASEFLSSWPQLVKDLGDLYQELEDISEVPTREQKGIWRDKVKLAIKLTSKVVSHSHLVPCKAWIKTAEEKMGILSELMKKLKGGNKIERETTQGTGSMERLCTEEEIDEFFTIYDDAFLEVEHAHSDNLAGGNRHDCPSPEVAEILKKGFGEETQSSGMGVAGFAAFSDGKLWEILGIVDGHVRGWHYHLHDYGQICRDIGRLSKTRESFDPTKDQFPYFSGPSPDGYSPCQLRWEQLVGVASILHKLCTPEENEGRRGILLADEVGIGKTGTILGVIALYMELALHSGKNSSFSPIFNKMKSFGAKIREEDLPVSDKPILIVCPVTLVCQWENEIHRFFPPGSVDVFVYTGGFSNHNTFFTEGKYALSKHSPHRRIIIASHPAISKDGQNVLRPSSGSYLGKPREVEDSFLSGGSALAQEYSIIAVDEAHNMRTRNALYTAALALRPRCNAMILATATPLFTQASDLINLQRVAGIGVIGRELDDFEKEAKKEMAQIKRSLKASGDADVSKLTAIQIAQVSRIRKRYGDRLIRRTHSSVRHDGTSLSNLPPFKVRAFYIQLTDSEKEVLQTLTKKGVEENQGETKFTGRNFYLDYRKAIGHKDWGTGGSPRLPKSLAEWEANKGTKLDVISQLCRHLLSDDKAPHPVSDEDGFFQLPDYDPPLNASKKRRILIYQEFRGLATLLQTVLRFRGVAALTLGGNDSPQKRQQTVQKFKENGTEARVLIFSKVGNAGLNLACADTVIFADQPWSAQEEQQIIGRAWRSPQKQTVQVYYLLAKGTTDVMMASMAVQKSKMLGGFFKENLQSPLLQFLNEDNLEWDPTMEQLEIEAGTRRYAGEIDEDEVESEDGAQLKKGRGKKKKPLNPRGTRKAKGLSTGEVEHDGIEESASTVVARLRKRRERTSEGEDKEGSLLQPEIKRFKQNSEGETRKSPGGSHNDKINASGNVISPTITREDPKVNTEAAETLLESPAKSPSQYFNAQLPPSIAEDQSPASPPNEPLTPPTCAQPSSRINLPSSEVDYSLLGYDEGAFDPTQGDVVPTSDPQEEELENTAISSVPTSQNSSLHPRLPSPPSTSKGKAPARGPWRRPPAPIPPADKNLNFINMLSNSVAILEKHSTTDRRKAKGRDRMARK